MASRDQPDNRQQQRIKQEQQDARPSDRGRQQDRGTKERQQANHAADKQQGRQRQPDPSRGGDKADKPTAPPGGSKQAAGGGSNRDPKSAQGCSSARPSSPSRDLKDCRGSSKDASKPAKEREAARSSKAPSSSTRDERHQEQPRDRGRARSRSRERPVQGQKDKGRDSGQQQERDRERTRDRDREHEQERDRDRRRDPGREREREREPGRGRHASPPAAQRPDGASGGQARNRAAPAAAIGPGPFSVVDKFLDKQRFVQEVLPPTPTNVHTLHVAGDELISFIKVQQWVEEKCGFALPLLSGIFVLVSSDDVPELSSKDVMDSCGYGKRGGSSSSGGGGSSSFAKDVATVIPWRLRQVEQVEVKPGEPAERARLLLEGGGCVEASQVRADTMQDVADYEYLCCELAHLQEARHMRALRVYDVAHIAWRMRLVGELEDSITEYKTRQAELKEAGYDAEMLEEVGRGSLDEIRGTMKKLPPLTWVDGQIMTYVELNPFARPEFPAESQGPLSRDQVASLMRCASDAWRHYVKNKLEGRPPQPVTEYVPWKPLPAGQVEALPDAAAMDQGDAGRQYGAQGYYQEPFTAQQGEPAAGAAGLQGQVFQQQPGPGLVLDFDDYEDDYGFFDDPLAPVEQVGIQLPGLPGLPMAGSAAGLSGPSSGSGPVLPKGLLGAGMSLAPTPSSTNAQLHTALSGGGLFAAAGSINAGAAGAQAAAAAADGTRGADYSYWVERGNAAAAATDPRRARAANRTGLAGLPSDSTKPGPLGPMWGGQKPPPGMADAGRPSKQQQDNSTQGGSGGRVSALDRLGPSGAARDRSRDRRDDREPRGRHDPSAFSIDARNRGRQSGSCLAGSRSPPPRGRNGGSGGSRGRSRSCSPPRGSPPRRRPRVRRFVTPPPSPRRGRDNTDGSPEGVRRQAAAAAASSPPGRRAAAGRGQSPRGGDHSPAKAHSSPGRAFSPSAGRGRGRQSSRDGRDRDRGRSGSPGSKRRRDGDSRDAGKRRPASPDGSKRRRRDSTSAAGGDADAGRGRHPSDRDPTSRRSRGAAADADAAAADGGRAAASSPVRDPEAVARRFDGRLENLDVVIADMQLEKDVKAWLRQLAEFLGPPPRPLEQPTPVKLGTLVKQLPLPGHIIRHYSSMTSFVLQRPELSFITDKSHIQLLPQFHADLLAPRKTPSPLPPPPGAAAGERSDEEDYLAGYRGSRRRGSAGRQEGGKKGSAAEAGREKASGGSGGRAAGSRSAEQQQQRRDEQEDRGAAAAAAAGGGGGGSTARREPAQEPPSRPSSRQGPRPESGDVRRRYADGAGRGGWADGVRAPVLTVDIADRVLREFGHKLSVALDASPGGRVPERLAYELMPLPLADRVKAGSKLSLMKLVDDYYPSFELRRDGPTGPPFVVRHPNPARNNNKWICKFWDPIKLDGCVKGQVCDFKHDLVPADRF